MESSSLILNHERNSDDRLQESTRKKRRKKFEVNQTLDEHLDRQNKRWKSDSEQQIYSSKLLQALRHLRRNASLEPPRSPPRIAVREAADRVLAIAAKGRTRWSRAILSNRLIRLKLRKVKKPRSPSGGSTRRSSPEMDVLRRKEKKAPALERRKSVLGRLVPGCRKLSLPVLLDEASDYISALQMQVRAMTALTELLCSAGPSQLAGSLAFDGRFDSTRFGGSSLLANHAPTTTAMPQPPPGRQRGQRRKLVLAVHVRTLLNTAWWGRREVSRHVSVS